MELTTAKKILRDSAILFKKTLEETLWPTRCVLCDIPGELLCRSCHVNLPYIDQLKACPICGAAHGKGICSECNRFILDWKHLNSFPLDGCVSATSLTPDTKRIVTCYKDRGERALAEKIAIYMANVMPFGWKDNSALVPIPARRSARRERGFDHIQLITHYLKKITGIPSVNALHVRAKKDQRVLGGEARLANMKESFVLVERPPVASNEDNALDLEHYERLIIIDDIMTTGATLFAAAETIRTRTSASICGVTFARA